LRSGAITKASRFDRQLSLFGQTGQEKIRAASVAVVGVGGLGTHVLQQLSLLGVGALGLIDPEYLDGTNFNRYVGVRYDDPVSGFRKVDLGERLIHSIDPSIRVAKVFDLLASSEAFEAVKRADFVFGCLDSEGARLVLTELCAAYSRPYLDLASDIVPGEKPEYGGRVCAATDGNGCLVCLGVLDVAEAQIELAGPEATKDLDAIYGVDRQLLGRVGPSVVSINGVVASLGLTEFMVAVTGIRATNRLVTYYGHRGTVTVSRDEPFAHCYFCKGLRGLGAQAEVERYFR
jgi:molybdopterin-synthase adenylyltransferase